MSATVAAFNALALLESLRGRGAVVSVKGHGAGVWLHVAPRAVLSDTERADFRRHKNELLELVTVQPVHRWQSASDATPATSAGAALDESHGDELGRAIAGARRGAWLVPTSELLSIWRNLEAFHGRSIQSHELAALAGLDVLGI